ncbi:MAG: hypothetical protein ACOCRO_07365 [Halanaerobiales bacterium]
MRILIVMFWYMIGIISFLVTVTEIYDKVYGYRFLRKKDLEISLIAGIGGLFVTVAGLLHWLAQIRGKKINYVIMADDEDIIWRGKI